MIDISFPFFQRNNNNKKIVFSHFISAARRQYEIAQMEKIEKHFNINYILNNLPLKPENQ